MKLSEQCLFFAFIMLIEIAQVASKEVCMTSACSDHWELEMLPVIKLHEAPLQNSVHVQCNCGIFQKCYKILLHSRDVVRCPHCFWNTVRGCEYMHLFKLLAQQTQIIHNV